jgi:hypothetical protein
MARHPTLAAVREAAAGLRGRTPESDRDAWAKMWIALLREHPSDSMPREVRGWLASFIEGELCLKDRRRGRPPPTLYRQIQTTLRLNIINARVDRWQRALKRRGCPGSLNEALRRVSGETNLTVARLRKYWYRRSCT